MLRLQNGITTDNASASKSDGGITGTGEDWIEDLGIQGALEGVGTSPYITGDFQIMSLGKIVKDPEYFRDERFNWPEGYAVRKFTSISVRRFILYILEGKELEFYMKKIQREKGKSATGATA